MQKRFLFLLFSIFILIGLATAFSVSANTCPTDNGQGVGCLDPSYPYYCGGQCRAQTQCPTWTPSPICAAGFTCTNCATADACGYCATCSGGYTRCGSWPSYTCIATVTPVSPCNSYDTCNNYCIGCISGYALCSSTHVCVVNPGCLPGQTFNACTASCEGSVSLLKLGYDSVSGSSVIQSATYPLLYINSSSRVGIGTTAPGARLEVIPPSGYSVLAGPSTSVTYKIGNVASPTADTDVATLGWVNSALASAGGGLWGGATGSNIWSLNSGNVGIGTTNPLMRLDVQSSATDVQLNLGGAAQSQYSELNLNTNSGSGNIWKSGSGYSSWGGTSALNIYNSNGAIAFHPNNTANVIYLSTSGNVGIGISSPNTKLRVNAAAGAAESGTATPNGISTLSATDTGVMLTSGVVGGSIAHVWLQGRYYNSTAAYPIILNPSGGNVGIGTTAPTAGLEVTSVSGGYAIKAGSYKIGNVALPTATADAATKGYVDSALVGEGGGGTGSGYLPLTGGTMSGAISFTDANPPGGVAMTLGGYDITGIGKLNVTTIDPLYHLNGVNYATFVSSIAGGVKEEYVGRAELYEKNRKTKEFEKVIDFDRIEEGSDLWVWRQVIDFNPDGVDAILTPYGRFASVYYLIDGNKLIFRSDRPVEISYRLIGQRFDWRDWPTKAKDQSVMGIKIK